jgi:sugar/nucleoside kinase (ribokinase family)
VIVRDGARGCTVTPVAGPTFHVAGLPVAAADTTGAGDAHTGALLACLAGGADLATASSVANAAAACSVTRAGSATGPTRIELELFLEARLE